MPPESVSVSVNRGVPLPFGLLYRLKVTVPVGLSPPLTVALSAMEVPTVALAGCWLVLIVGRGRGDGHRLEGGAAGDRGVVAVAVVGGDPVVGAGGGGGVALRGGHAAGERLGVGEQGRAAAGRSCCRG